MDNHKQNESKAKIKASDKSKTKRNTEMSSLQSKENGSNDLNSQLSGLAIKATEGSQQDETRSQKSLKIETQRSVEDEIYNQSQKVVTTAEVEDKICNTLNSAGDTNANEFEDNVASSQTEEEATEEDADDGEPIPSGTGVVNKDCSASDLIGWSEVLPKWHSKLNQRPKGLSSLVRNGIPEPLRGEVWQLLSGAQQYSDLMDQYRIFLTKSAPAEQIILRDVHRTYPAHENFRTGGGSSSLLDSLFKVCKAYAVYDEEIGYCQGLSFLVAALLLHMPEEQAFCVFVCIMQHYGLRNLFRNNFDELYLKFYQLERLLEDHMPDLYKHFKAIGIEPFTYASQWFLTVFTAKFPLYAVFYIMDIFLLDGMDTIFQVALALLGASKPDLLAQDFEGVLKYFRVQMPKRYRNQENVQQLIEASTVISLRRLKKHAKAYEAMKQKEKLLENPITRLQRENAKLTENNIRLEQENDDLARDLVASKIQLRAQLDMLEDKAETLNRALTYSRQDCHTYMNTISDMEDERSRLEVEVSQLKEVCRRELQRAESEQARDRSIIADYKKICSKLSKRIDYRFDVTLKFIEATKDLLRDNGCGNDRKCFEIFCSKTNELIESLGSDSYEQISSSSQSASPSKPNEYCQELRTSSIESDPTNRTIGAYLKTAYDKQSTSSEHKIQQLTKHVDDLEVELARTKLALVEAECRCQQLTHDMNVGVTVKTPSANNAGKFLTQQTFSNQQSTLSNKLVSMTAAITSSRRSPKSSSTGGSTFAKINHIISERISNMGQGNQMQTAGRETTISSSKSTPSISKIANLDLSGSVASNLTNNNNSLLRESAKNQNFQS